MNDSTYKLTAGIDYVNALHQLLDLIPEVERLREKGELAALHASPYGDFLKTTHIFTSFAKLAECREPLDSRFRALLIGQATAPAKSFFLAPDVKFPAIAYSDISSRQACASAHFEDAVFELSTQRIKDIRDWSIGFDFWSDEIRREFDIKIAGLYLNRLISDVTSVNRIEFTETLSHVLPNDIPTLVGEEFERLTIDILNEVEGWHCHKASLYEDLMESTDLRFGSRHLKRKNGARIQVSLLSSERFRRDKEKRTGRHVVLLTPLTLARWILKRHPKEPDHELREAWAELISTAGSAEELSTNIKRSFLEALDQKHSHPLGPIGRVSRSLRKLVGCFAVDQAINTTYNLRFELDRRGGTRRRRYWKKSKTE